MYIQCTIRGLTQVFPIPHEQREIVALLHYLAAILMDHNKGSTIVINNFVIFPQHGEAERACNAI